MCLYCALNDKARSLSSTSVFLGPRNAGGPPENKPFQTQPFRHLPKCPYMRIISVLCNLLPAAGKGGRRRREYKEESQPSAGSTIPIPIQRFHHPHPFSTSTPLSHRSSRRRKHGIISETVDKNRVCTYMV